jgi:two-component sensor histidine kinase
VIAEKEAVPIALVLNELMLNAVKHGGQAQGGVNITLRKGAQADVVQVTISNPGQFSPHRRRSDTPHHGLELISALMPRTGASLLRHQQDNLVITVLALQPPVISLDQKEPS